jgi:hypothetical protein
LMANQSTKIKLRSLHRPPTAFPRRRRRGILGVEFLLELNHQLELRNLSNPYSHSSHLDMLDHDTDVYAWADQRFDAHVDALLDMYGAPTDSRTSSDQEPINNDSTAWRRVALALLIDVLDLGIFDDSDQILESCAESLYGGGESKYENVARHFATIVVNTQHPGLRLTKRTGRPNRWSPLRLSQLLLDHENGKVVDRRRLHDAQNAELNPLAPYVMRQHEDKLLCEAVRDTVRIMGRAVRKRIS